MVEGRALRHVSEFWMDLGCTLAEAKASYPIGP